MLKNWSCFKIISRAKSISINNLYTGNYYFRHLEKSLELIQNEFESMEDYWQTKTNKERAFYEEQLKVSETQFKEVDVRMKEYKDLLESFESSKYEYKQNLFTIDEQRCLE